MHCEASTLDLDLRIAPTQRQYQRLQRYELDEAYLKSPQEAGN